MIKMICVLGLVCLCSTATQDLKSDPWKAYLLPPRNNTQLGFTYRLVDGKLRIISRDPSDKLAQRGWIEHRLMKQPGDLQLWQEYLELLEKNDALKKPSREKALFVVQKALKQSPNDPRLMLLRIQLYDMMELTEQDRQGLVELNQKHPQFIPGLIASNKLTFFDKKYDEGIQFARELAKKYPNVFLEPSALGSKGSDPNGENLRIAMQRMREAGVVDRIIYGSDGPQSPGFVKDYLARTVEAMRAAGYTAAEAEAVLSGNFARNFGVSVVAP